MSTMDCVVFATLMFRQWSVVVVGGVVVEVTLVVERDKKAFRWVVLVRTPWAPRRRSVEHTISWAVAVWEDCKKQHSHRPHPCLYWRRAKSVLANWVECRLPKRLFCVCNFCRAPASIYARAYKTCRRMLLRRWITEELHEHTHFVLLLCKSE